MATLTSTTVTSRDGTKLAVDIAGSGPAIVLVSGGSVDRGSNAGLADALKAEFTTYNYDRRGRGDSGDTAPYAVQREIEDIDAVIGAAGGPAGLYGSSSGAALALEATAAGLAISKLALWEPPYILDPNATSIRPRICRASPSFRSVSCQCFSNNSWCLSAWPAITLLSFFISRSTALRFRLPSFFRRAWVIRMHN
jgi:alpha-beta hydrolase superfamily lysophospholipase